MDISPCKGTNVNVGNDSWSFLEHIDAPKWADLEKEAALAGVEGDDPWFHQSHIHHEQPLLDSSPLVSPGRGTIKHRDKRLGPLQKDQHESHSLPVSTGLQNLKGSGLRETPEEVVVAPRAGRDPSSFQGRLGKPVSQSLPMRVQQLTRLPSAVKRLPAPMTALRELTNRSSNDANILVSKSSTDVPTIKHAKDKAVSNSAGPPSRGRRSMSSGEDIDVTAMLAEHNRKFRVAPQYEPRLHSTKDVKEWELLSGQKFYELDPAERERANQEIAVIKRSRKATMLIA